MRGRRVGTGVAAALVAGRMFADMQVPCRKSFFRCAPEHLHTTEQIVIRIKLLHAPMSATDRESGNIYCTLYCTL